MQHEHKNQTGYLRGATTMIPMQMEPQAIMSLGSKEQGCIWDADRKVEAGEQGFQAQPGKQGLRWMRLL